MSSRFDRTASPTFESLLVPGGALHPLVAAPGRLSLLDVPLVAHLRPDRVTIYAGLTSVLEIRFSKARLSVGASSYYARQSCAQKLFGAVTVANASKIVDAWPTYRDAVKVAERYVRSEGILQATLIERYGAGFNPDDEWCVIDREAVITYPSDLQRRAFESKVKAALRPVRHAIDADRSIRTGKKVANDFGRELDILAVTPEGDLVLGEMKDGGDTAGIYMSPLQLAGYVRMWRQLADDAGAELVDAVNAMISQRVRVGLLPPHAPRLRRGFRLLPALMIGEPKARSSAWSSLEIVAGHLRRQQPEALDGLRIYSLALNETGLSLHPRPHPWSAQ